MQAKNDVIDVLLPETKDSVDGCVKQIESAIDSSGLPYEHRIRMALDAIADLAIYARIMGTEKETSWMYDDPRGGE